MGYYHLIKITVILNPSFFVLYCLWDTILLKRWLVQTLCEALIKNANEIRTWKEKEENHTVSRYL